MARWTCVRAVSGLTKRRSATSSLDSPSAASAITSVSRAVSAAKRSGTAREPGSGAARKRVISALVAVGESSASPPATVRMPSSRSLAEASLPRKPLTPARTAWATYSSSSNVVRISTRVSTSSGSAQIAAVAAKP